jgi:GNAT superfamily N-acetyltransferase
VYNDFTVQRAAPEEIETAYSIVEEYYESASVMARDSKEEFAAVYFQKRAGVWLARKGAQTIGCIALRILRGEDASAEVKRLYVRPAHRRCGVAQALLNVMEAYAADCGYGWLYLDSASGMDAAVRFYRRNGYEACPRYNDNPQASVFLRKRISSR